MKNKKYSVIFLLVMLTGCGFVDERNKRVEDRENLIRTTGDVTNIGIVDGCNITHHKREVKASDHDGYEYHSFYIAKCDGKETITTTQKVGGKQKRDEAMVQVNK